MLSEDACSVLVPVLEEIFHWDSSKIRAFFEPQGLALQEWDKIRTNMIPLCAAAEPSQAVVN